MDKNVEKIVVNSRCNKHGSLEGIPCWRLFTANGILSAICNNRAKKAGYRGLISPQATSRSGR